MTDAATRQHRKDAAMAQIQLIVTQNDRLVLLMLYRFLHNGMDFRMDGIDVQIERELG